MFVLNLFPQLQNNYIFLQGSSFKKTNLKMKKVILIASILILSSSLSAVANNNKSIDKNCINPNSIEIQNNLNFKIADKELADDAIVILTKYQFKRKTTGKSRIKNVQNFLKNPEKKNIETAVC